MARQTRREFLEDSLLAAAVTALAGCGAAQSARAAQQSSSPNERLRVALIGAGPRSGEHVKMIAPRADCEIVTVCDVDEDVAQKRIAAIDSTFHKKPAFVRDLRKVFDDKSIDVVAISTPNHWHALAAIWAMQAGKDVYLEKPVGHNVSEARRIVEAARKYSRICQAATQSRSSPGTQEMMGLLQSGAIGEIKLARALSYKPRRSIGPKGTYDIPKTVDYDLWCGPAPAKVPCTRPKFHYDWHFQWDYGNGESGGQGPHQVDIARWGMGIAGFGNAVVSYGGRLVYQDARRGAQNQPRVWYEDAGETANMQVSIHDFGDRAITFEIRNLDSKPYQDATVGIFFYGTKGYALHGGRSAKLSEEDGYDGGTIFDGDGKVVRVFKGIGHPECDKSHFDNFVQGVRSRKVSDLRADIEDGHLSAGLSHMANIAYRLGEQLPVVEIQKRLEQGKFQTETMETFGRVRQHLTDNQVNLDATKLWFGSLAIGSKTESFTGPDSGKANLLLTREYRKGYEVPARLA